MFLFERWCRAPRFEALSQLRREKDGYTYTENSSKNRAGGIAQLKLDNKSVFIAEVPEAGERCHCKLLDKYISKLPQEAIDADLFYLQPLRKVVTDSQKWYSSVPVGKNMLYKMVNTICAQGGIELKSNHSLRATGATELYNAGVPEKIIKERTGHRSLESLQMYERTSDKQQHAVSRILSSDRETSFNAEMNKTTSTHLNYSHGQPVMNFSNCQVTIAYNQGNVTGSTMSSTQQAL